MKSKITILSAAVMAGLYIFLLGQNSLVQPVFAATPPASTTNGQEGGFVPCGNTSDNPCTVAHLFRAFVAIVNYLIVTAGFVAVVAIVYAGFLMVTSQGEQRLAEAKKRLSGAIIGIVIVAAAFILINALFSGSLSIGVRNGGQILTNPRAYINGQ